MSRQRHSIDSEFREYSLAAGRVALVCYLFLIPFQSADSLGNPQWDQQQVGSQLAWWSPVDQLSPRLPDVRQGLSGAFTADRGALAAPKLAPHPAGTFRKHGQAFLHPSLVELQVRLQV